MMGWIVAIGLYLLGFSFFHWLGGLDSAAEAFRRWGSHEAARRRRRVSSST